MMNMLIARLSSYYVYFYLLRDYNFVIGGSRHVIYFIINFEVKPVSAVIYTPALREIRSAAFIINVTRSS